jgi:hypothetical protein
MVAKWMIDWTKTAIGWLVAVKIMMMLLALREARVYVPNCAILLQEMDTLDLIPIGLRTEMD